MQENFKYIYSFENSWLSSMGHIFIEKGNKNAKFQVLLLSISKKECFEFPRTALSFMIRCTIFSNAIIGHYDFEKSFGFEGSHMTMLR